MIRPRSRPRGPTSFRKVAVAFVLLLSVGLIAAYVVHDRYVAYRPSAARHLPKGASFAVRFDLTHVMFYEPFRRYLAPLVDQIGRESGAAEGRRARLEARGIRVIGDIREVVVAFGSGSSDWFVAVGGRLPPRAVAAELAAVLREDGHRLSVERGVFNAPRLGLAFAQAEDSSLVLAPNPDKVLSALAPSSPPEDLGGAGGFFLTHPGLPEPLRSAGGRFRPGSVVALDAEVAFVPSSTAGQRSRGISALGRLLGPESLVAAAFDSSHPPTDQNPARWRVRFSREVVEALAEGTARAATVALSNPP